MRIFGKLRWMRVSCWSIGIYTVVWAIVVIVVEFTQCIPLQGTWDKTIDAKCIQSGLFFVIGSALNTVVDFVIVGLPLRAVWNLKMATWQKFSVSGIFLLGSLTCVISLVRLVVVGQNYTNLDITCEYHSARSRASPTRICRRTPHSRHMVYCGALFGDLGSLPPNHDASCHPVLWSSRTQILRILA